MTEVYTSEELDAIENHITANIGNYKNVFHEVVPHDIRVDICIIEPTPECNYYTLVTMGMGGHRMNVPEKFAKYQWERAELLIQLPADWNLKDLKDDRWYWPIRWMKILARFPIEENTWLGWGHTVPNGEPFADNTQLSTMLLSDSYNFGEKADKCELPNGDIVNFYQIIALYEEEADFKVENGMQALTDRFGYNYPDILDISRPNCCAPQKTVDKKWAIRKEDMRDFIEWEGAAGCLATDRILVDGENVGYMYREEPDPDNTWDSGWRFSAGDESDEYMDDPNNSGIYVLNTICNYDPEVIPLLRSNYGVAYLRNEDGIFEEEEYIPLED